MANKVFVACEGEPSADYSNDPEGLIAVIDVASGEPENTATIIGFTDFNIGGSRHNELPAGVGMYQPDTIASYQVINEQYVVTANEGDAREYISGEINEDYESQVRCEAEDLNWDVSVSACFEGDTPDHVCNERLSKSRK